MTVQEFLLKHKMTGYDPKTEVLNFVDEAKRGLRGETCSMKMLPSYISAQGTLTPGKPIIAIDAGGTNLRVGLVYYNEDNTWTIENETHFPMPGTYGELEKDVFYDHLAEKVAPYAAASDLIGFCFSFPFETMENMDGAILQLAKEVKVKDSEGSLLGAELCKALNRRGIEGSWKVIVLNDTVAALLAGLSEGIRYNAKNYIGVILGTGMNICYEQNNAGILKAPTLAGKPGSSCINEEAGIYDRFERGDIDEEIDAGSVIPGDHLFEKRTSGAYQGLFVKIMLRKAAEEGLFTEPTAKALKELKELSSAQADAFARDPEAGNLLADMIAPEDKETAMALVDAFYQMVAETMTFALTGTMVVENEGSEDDRPTCIVADGSAFYRTKLFRPKLDAYMEKVAGGIFGQKYVIVKAEAGNLPGAAAAALLNA